MAEVWSVSAVKARWKTHGWKLWEFGLIQMKRSSIGSLSSVSRLVGVGRLDPRLEGEEVCLLLARELGVLKFSSAEIPFSSYHESWAKDIMVVPFNGIRLGIKNSFRFFELCGTHGLARSSLLYFGNWFGGFIQCIRHLWGGFEHILIPFIEGFQPLPQKLTRPWRERMRTELLYVADKVVAASKEPDIREGLVALHTNLRDLVSKLLGWAEAFEQSLVEQLEIFGTEPTVRDIEIQMVDWICEQPDGMDGMAVLLAW
eukprot:CAMPEP_0184684694 /NCGR_PEP_ID=MMETSP0312-20130426/16351_1 /TAXON_ID=31354 /ORGANISM="Compsopogon coeruleus, Strain SAG 36.94" /LENGTH=257 /DNA_ID=CAMNT_0027138159 /DNA_START=34 /DNA_END=805 /DNA_ORIENTATION=+